VKRTGAFIFSLALLYPLAGLFAPVGAWRWNQAGTLDAVQVSLVLTAIAMVIVVVLGTPMALYVARCSPRERVWWQGALLASVLLPPLALGILLSLAFGAKFANTSLAFVVTQVYSSIGYYVLGAVAALERVPPALEVQAGLLGHDPWSVFWRVTYPIARLGFAVALSIAWVRALTEFGAILITAYYPAGMPVAIWTNLESFGLPAVMPLMIVFLLTALPLPWLAHVLAQRKAHETQYA
jgi:molybdate/tungstate transport system permease protein